MTNDDTYFRPSGDDDATIYEPVRSLLDSIDRIVRCHEAHILLVDDSVNTAELEVVIQKSGDERSRVRPRETTILRYRGLRGITGQAARMQRIYNVPNVLECAFYLEHFGKTRSEIAVPIIWNGMCLAVINLELNQEDYFSREVEMELEALRHSPLVIEEILALHRYWKARRVHLDLALYTALMPWCSRMLCANTRVDLCRTLADACLDLLLAVDIVEIALADPQKHRMHNLHRTHRSHINLPDVRPVGEHFPWTDSLSQAFQLISEFDLNRPQDSHGLLDREVLNEYGIRYGIRALFPAEDLASAPGCITLYSSCDLYTLHEANEKIIIQLSEFAALAFEKLVDKTVLDAQQQANKFCRNMPSSVETQRQVLELAALKSGASAGWIFLPQGGTLVQRVSFAEEEVTETFLQHPSWEQIACVTNGREVICRIIDLNDSEEWREADLPAIDMPVDNDAISLIAVPLECGESEPGVLCVVGRRAFLPQDTRIVEAISAEVGSALSALSERISVFDYLNHESRTPISNIRKFSASLLKHWDWMPDDQKRDRIAKIGIRAEALSDVVATLADIRKLADDPDYRSEEVKAVSLASLIVRSLDICEISPQDTKLRIGWDAIYSVPDLCVNPKCLGGVFTNLLKNALKYSFKDSDSYIRLYVEESDPSTITFCIQNEAPAISKEERDTLFQRDTRAQWTKERAIGGKGLGLFFSREIITLLSGKIELELTYQADAEATATYTFKVHLPVNVPSATSKENFDE